MLQFTALSWLALPALVAIAGALALWRSRARPRAVPSTKLWQGLEGPAGKGARRNVDPLWLIMLAGAILAALCLAGPQWVSAAPQQAPVIWSLRSVAIDQKMHAQLWIQWKDAPADTCTLRAGGQQIALAGKDLRAGISLPIESAGDAVDVQLLDASANKVAAETFLRPAEHPFALLTLAAKDHPIDPALLRAFTVQPGATLGDPTLRPAVLLINDPALSPADPALQGASLVVAEPATPLPGITPGEWLTAPQGGWPATPTDSTFKWPPFVSLKSVRVNSLRTATFSPEWHIIATAGGHPWLALRTLPAAGDAPCAWLWMASEPLAHALWPADASFVLFFANLGVTYAHPGDNARITVWEAQHQHDKGELPRRWSLALAVGGLAMFLLAGASIWFLLRAQNFSPRKLDS